jgi:hypothetical protein
VTVPGDWLLVFLKRKAGTAEAQKHPPDRNFSAAGYSPLWPCIFPFSQNAIAPRSRIGRPAFQTLGVMLKSHVCGQSVVPAELLATVPLDRRRVFAGE